jgi:large subunit ribosomal protein L25
MKKFKLKTQKRTLVGRKVKALREQGLLPANVYGKKIKSQALTVGLKDFSSIYQKAGETNIVDLMIGKTTKPVLVHNVQTHPVTDEPIHVDFLQVDLKQKVTATIPVEMVGESPAEKEGKGVLVQQLTEIEVEALPTNLPEKFEVNVSKLTEVDQSILVRDLKYDQAKIVIKLDSDQIIAKVEPPQKEEEVAPPPVEEKELEEEAVKESKEVEEVEEKEEPKLEPEKPAKT